MGKNVIIPIILLVGIIGMSFIGGKVLAVKKDVISTTECIDKIVVYKSKRKMLVYSGDVLVKKYHISTGLRSGKKTIVGDLKTPEGDYYINGRNPYSSCYKNLGISYPNKDDIAKAKRLGKNPGGQIKIHGTKNGRKDGHKYMKRNWTAGCIAVSNKDMEELYNMIETGTVIKIYR